MSFMGVQPDSVVTSFNQDSPTRLPGWSLFGVLALRDADLAVHAARTTILATGLAREIGIETSRQAFWGFLLHDVGTLEVPESILLQEGPLSASDRGVIETHPLRSAKIFQQVDDLSTATPIVLHHHERWDGGGYPSELSGEEVPAEARLLAVADTFIALLSPRPYRPARTLDEAIAVILEEAGRQLDPKIARELAEIAPYLPRGLTRSNDGAATLTQANLASHARRARDLSRAQLEALFASALGLDAIEAADRFGRAAGTQRNWTSSLRRTIACPPRVPLPRFFGAIGRLFYETTLAAAQPEAYAERPA